MISLYALFGLTEERGREREISGEEREDILMTVTPYLDRLVRRGEEILIISCLERKEKGANKKLIILPLKN